jgi:predicted transport protein
VDIVPQAKRLRLSLNMPFAELNDPRGLAKNLLGIGRWGNGEVEIGVATLEEVPYALGLIRQSLERQLEEES